MAEEETEPKRESESSSSSESSTAKSKPTSFIKKKMGPLPLWGWVVLGAGVLLLFKMHKSGTTKPAGSAAIGPNTVASGSTSMPSGFTTGGSDGSLDALISQIQAAQQAAAASAPTPNYTTNFTGEKLVGGGYSLPTGFGQPGSIITPQGVFSWVTSSNTANEIVGSGGSLYAQTTPGSFTDVTSMWGHGLAGGTPIFTLTGPAQAPITGQVPSGATLGSGRIMVPL